jgi:hypothetical protein
LGSGIKNSIGGINRHTDSRSHFKFLKVRKVGWLRTTNKPSPQGKYKSETIKWSDSDIH